MIWRTKLSRFIALAACVCMLLSLFCACGKNTAKTIRVPLTHFPPCFDPQIANGIDTESILNNCFEGLVRIDENGSIKKGVAESWQVSGDGCTYTFKLRSNAMWHLPKNAADTLGDDYESTFDAHVKAEDFVFAVKRAMDPDTKAPLANALNCISNIYASDATTLTIKLSKPSVSFLSVLASPICMPCNEEFFEATGGRYGLETGLILSNGPFYVGNIDEEVGITLYSSDSYNGIYKPIADTVKFLYPSSFLKTTGSSDSQSETAEETTAPDLMSLLTAEEGGYDAATVTYADTLNLEDSFTVRKYKNTIKAICFNSTGNYTSNSDIRLALAHATDPRILCGTHTIAEGIVPSCCELVPGTSYRAGSDIIPLPTFSLKTAAEHLSSVTALEVIDSTINLDFLCLKEDETKVKEMLQEWQKVFGVSLSVKLITMETQEDLDKAIRSGNYDVAYTDFMSSEFLAADFLNRFKSGSGQNSIFLKSEEYDALLGNIYNASSEQALIAANKDAETFLVSRAYILPIYAGDGYLAVKDTAKDLSVRPSGTVYAFYTAK